MKYPELSNLDNKTISQIDYLKDIFKNELKDSCVKRSDWFILRFLIARKMNLEKTEKMLK